ncbi:tetratricopeptide repeat protein [Mucilaginibacter roseus]|uniref:Tetratricopeptide repeat protein n=1 Tax=Mucilaginibacter roseus TaxID=1528868 RepID=A0ABS8TZ97_9SPHI|nr:tetratricopeptide repeat protein [Mucilaginibacter roseus]MCD8739143.1 tetratricopeptide repeat protein [Mucilaginibacter roseus]
MRYCLITFLIWLLSGLLFIAATQASQPSNPQKTTYSNARSSGDTNNSQKVFINAKHRLNKAIAGGDNEIAAQCYQELGDLLYMQTAYSQALDNFFKADKLLRHLNTPLKLAANINKIGQTYLQVRQYPAAEKAFREALNIYRSNNNRNGIAGNYGFIGHTYEKRGNYPQAIYYQKLALKEYILVQNTKEIANIYENLGSIHEDKLQLDSALKYFKLAEQINAKNNNETDQIEVINNLGDVLRKSGKYQQSLVYTHRAVALAGKLKDQYQLGSAYRDLSKAYHLLNRNDSAFYYSEASRDIFLKIFTEDNEKQLALLQTIFEIEQKNSAIDRFKSEKTINRIIAIGATVITCLIALLAATFISRQRLKLRNEQKLNEQSQLSYKNALDIKSKELTSHTLHIIRKNQLLDELKEKLKNMIKDDKRDQRRELHKLLNMIQLNSNQDKNWEDFRIVFEQVHDKFFDTLKEHPAGLTSSDMRLLALLKMNLGSADMATMLGISQDSLRIARYRLRKKLGLDEGETLQSFIKTVTA